VRSGISEPSFVRQKRRLIAENGVAPSGGVPDIDPASGTAAEQDVDPNVGGFPASC
jgi:hypothetical protein